METLIGNPTTFVSELIWTVINFFLLLFLLKRFLYNPVIRFTEERSARMAAKLAEERGAQTAVEENRNRLADEKAGSRAEAKRILNEAGDESERRHAEAVAAARQDAGRIRKEGEAALGRQREATAEKLRRATPELAEALAERLLG